MADDVGVLDPFGVIVARGELDAVSDRRAAAALREGGRSDVECARLIGNFLLRTAQQLSVTWPPDAAAEDICRDLMRAAARSGKIDAGAYRLLQELRRAFGRSVPRDAAAAS